MSKNKNLISLIENNQAEEFAHQLFENRLDGKNTNCYTIPLSDDEEKALIHRVTGEQKDSHWYKALSDYISHYPLSNAAIEFLLTGIGNAMAIKLICLQFARYGYTPEQGEKICRLIKNEWANKIFFSLLPAISKYGRIFDEDTYNMLWNIDERLREQKAEKANFAESYKKNVYNYRKQNGLFNHQG